MSQATRLSPADTDALGVAFWSCQRDPAFLAARADVHAAFTAYDAATRAAADVAHVEGLVAAHDLAELRSWVALFAARAADLEAFAAGLPAGLLRDRAEAAAKKAQAQHARKAATLAKRTA